MPGRRRVGRRPSAVGDTIGEQDHAVTGMQNGALIAQGRCGLPAEEQTGPAEGLDAAVGPADQGSPCPPQLTRTLTRSGWGRRVA